MIGLTAIAIGVYYNCYPVAALNRKGNRYSEIRRVRFEKSEFVSIY